MPTKPTPDEAAKTILEVLSTRASVGETALLGAVKQDYADRVGSLDVFAEGLEHGVKAGWFEESGASLIRRK